MDFKNFLKSLNDSCEEARREGISPRQRSSRSDASARQSYATGGNVEDRRREKVRELAAKGRYGDTEIAEVGPRTARTLDYLIHGGHKEINPITGLREYPPKIKGKAKGKTAKSKVASGQESAKGKATGMKTVDSGIKQKYLRKQGTARSCGASCAMTLSHHYNNGLPTAFKTALDINRTTPKTVKKRDNTYKKRIKDTPASGYNSEEAVSEVYNESLPASAYRVSPSGTGAEITRMAPKMGFKVGKPTNVPDLIKLQESVKKGKPAFLNLETPSGANHAALLTGYNGSTLHIADPKNGKIEKVKFNMVPYNLKPKSFLAKEGYPPSTGKKKDYDIPGVKLKSGEFYITQVSDTSKN